MGAKKIDFAFLFRNNFVNYWQFSITSIIVNVNYSKNSTFDCKVCIMRPDHICFEKSLMTFWQVCCYAVVRTEHNTLVKSMTKIFSNFVAFSNFISFKYLLFLQDFFFRLKPKQYKNANIVNSLKRNIWKLIKNKVNIYNEQLNFWLNNWRLHNWRSGKPQLMETI